MYANFPAHKNTYLTANCHAYGVIDTACTNIRNSKQNPANQGPKRDCLMCKTKGRKSHDAVPIIKEHAQFREGID
jgi:hypothetical protein